MEMGIKTAYREQLDKQLTFSKISNFFLVIVVLSVPFNSFSLFRIADFGVSLGLIALGLFIIFSSFRIRIRLTFPTIFILIYLFYCVILNMPVLFFRGLSLSDFSRSFLLLSFLVVGYIILSNYEVSIKFVYRLLLTLIAISIPVMLYGFYQLPARQSGLPLAYIPSSYLVEPAGSDIVRFLGYARIQSVFLEPAHYGDFLGILLCLTFPLINLPNPKKVRIFLYFALMLEIFSIILALPFSSYLYLFLTIFIFLFIKQSSKARYKRRFINNKELLTFIFFMVAVLVGGLLFINLHYKINILHIAFHRLNNLPSEGSFKERVFALGESFSVALNNVPLFGVGLGNVQNWFKLNYPYPHYIQNNYKIATGYGYLIVSSGMIGFSIFILFIGSSFRNVYHLYLVCLRDYYKSVSVVAVIAEISLLAFIFLIVSMLFSGIFINFKLWTLLGLINLSNNAILKFAELKKEGESL